MAKIKRSIPLFESKWSGLMLLSDEEVGCIVKNLIRHANGKDTNVFTNDYIEAMFYILLDDLSTFDEHKEEERERKSEYRKKKGNMSTDKNTCPTDIEECPTDKNTCPDTELNGTELNSTELNGTELNCTELNGTDNTLMSGEPDGRVVEIVDYLNLVLGTHYKVNGKKTSSLIRSRLKEGYTVEDFKQVITKKYAEWAGTEREKYLRPETLFCADHFEGYLNQTFVKEERKKGPVETAKEEWAEWLRQQEQEQQQQQEQGGGYIDADGICEADDDSIGFLPEFI